MKTIYDVRLVISDDCQPTPLTSKEVAEMVESMKLEAGVEMRIIEIVIHREKDKT